VSGLVSGSVATLITDLVPYFAHFTHIPLFMYLISLMTLHTVHGSIACSPFVGATCYFTTT